MTDLLVHIPYASSTKAKDKFSRRKQNKFLEPLSDRICLNQIYSIQRIIFISPPNCSTIEFTKHTSSMSLVLI